MSSVEEEEAYKLYDQWMKEEVDSVRESDPLTKQFAYKSFVSYSNGRGRKRRRRARQVELIVDKERGEAVALKDVASGRIDVWANQALGDILPTGEDTFIEFVARLKALANLGNR